MLRSTLIAASRSHRCRRVVESLPASRTLVDRFVVGATAESAVENARRLTTDRLVTLDQLGEDVTDRAQAARTAEAYRALLRRVGDGGLAATIEVSVKPSALGQALPCDGEQVALDNIRLICETAARVGTTVTVDMEDHTTTDSTLSIVQDLRVDFPWTGAVLQAYLHRTQSDCVDLASPGSRVRLCKGAYDEPASVAYRDKREVDAAYVKCLKTLMNGKCYPMVATHDHRLIAIARYLAETAGRSPDEYEFQMLYGVRPALQRRVADDDRRMRVYLPYGSEWYPYFIRRLGERPANLAFFARALLQRR